MIQSIAGENQCMILFSTIASARGGGVAKILALLHSVHVNERVLVRKGSQIDRNWSGKHKIVLSKHRFLAEVQALLYCFGSVDVKYINLAGPPPIWTGCFRIKVVSEVSYSQIFYPEIDFRGDNSSLKTYFRDTYRGFLMTRLEKIIVQTPLLQEKANDLYPRIECSLIKPARPAYIEVSDETFFESPKEPVRVLFLCNDQRNKRVELFKYFIVHGELEYELITTMNKNSVYFQELKSVFGEKLISIGNKSQNELSEVLKSIDVVANLALLESFSNNLLEAWSSNTILLLPFKEWAFQEARDAALYFDEQNIKESVKMFESCLCDKGKTLRLISNGKMRLMGYPTYDAKYESYINV